MSKKQNAMSIDDLINALNAIRSQYDGGGTMPVICGTRSLVKVSIFADNIMSMGQDDLCVLTFLVYNKVNPVLQNTMIKDALSDVGKKMMGM